MQKMEKGSLHANLVVYAAQHIASVVFFFCKLDHIKLISRFHGKKKDTVGRKKRTPLVEKIEKDNVEKRTPL